MSVNPGYTRRKELKCTLAELSTYGSVILYDGEVLYVEQADGKYAVKIGDGVTNIATLPYVINYSEVAAQATAAGNSATAASNSATTAGNKALDAEAYAKGTRNGVDVDSSDPAYHNNAKYFKDQASTIAEEKAEEVLEDKADVDGSYETLHAGTATEAISAKSIKPVSAESGTEQDDPFISQGSGTANNSGSVDAPGVVQLLEKQGNTIVKNQLVNPTSLNDIETTNDVVFTKSDDKYTLSGTASAWTRVAFATSSSAMHITGHKYLIMGASDKVTIRFNGVSGNIDITSAYAVYTGDSSNYAERPMQFIIQADTNCAGVVIKPKIIDLTQWFNGNDNIPADLLSNPSHWSWYDNGTGSYDAGSLKNASGRYLGCTKRNLWDEQWESGGINASTGATQTDANRIRSKNFNILVPNRSYYIYGGAVVFLYDKDKNFITTRTNQIFESPPNAFFFKIRLGSTGDPVTSYGHDVSLTLYYTPEQGGEGYGAYYPYVETNVYDTGTEELLAFDKKVPSGVITRATGTVDLGTLTWTKYSGDNPFFYATNSFGAKEGSVLICPKYINDSVSATSTGDKCVNLVQQGTQLRIRDSAYNSSGADAFKTAMSGVILTFELATPTTEQGTAYPEDIEDHDYGMMYWLDTDGNLVGVPQGCKIFYPFAYVEGLDTLFSYTQGDMTSLVLKDDVEGEENARGAADTILQNAVGGALRQQLAQAKSIDFLNTGCVDLGTLTWTLNQNGVFSATLVGGKPSLETDEDSMFLSTKYKTVTSGTGAAHTGEDKVIFKGVSSAGYCYIDIRDTAYADATAFANAMKGVLLAYELAD